MTEAFIYDAVRTPRGKGKKDGALHQVTPVWLLAQALHRGDGATATSSTPRWSTTWCSAASRRSASRAPTSRAPRRSTPSWAESVAGVTSNRFCASGLEA